MASSLFQGDPLKAPSYAATTSDVPQWLQDYTVDLFSQQRAVSGTPYQPYTLPRIAETTAPTTASQNLITSTSGAYQPAMQGAIAGTQALTGPTAGTVSGLGMMQQAANMSGIGAAQPLFNQAASLTGQAGATNTAAALEAGQAAYTNPALMAQNLNQGQASLARAGQQDVMGAASPYLQAAGQTATSNIGEYMNPYTQSVTDQIARLGARNLSENLLPAVSDQFTRAGQFGSSRMGTFGERALRDTQEAILNQQSQALQAGYGQALNAAQTDLSRQGQLAQTAGQLTGQQAQNLANLGQTYTQAGQAQQTTGLSAEQAEAQARQADAQRQLAAAGQLGDIGQQTGALTQAGQQNLATIGAQTAATAQAEAARQAAAQQQVGDLARTQQGLTIADAAALESVGAAQQAQTQKGLDVAYQDFQNQIKYPQEQINAMSATLRGLPPTAVPTTGTQTGYTTNYGPSPLSQLAGAYGVYKGLTTGSAKGGLIDGYADGGAVKGTEDLYGSVMADYGQYLTKPYEEKMANAMPAIERNKNAVANMATYHASNAPIASPNTLPAMYKKYNEMRSGANPAALNEAADAANALQAKYNEQYNALNPSAVTAAADAANAKLKEMTDPAAILLAYNSGAYDIPIDINAKNSGKTITSYVNAGYSIPSRSPYMVRPPFEQVSGVLPASKQAEYDTLLNNYNTLNTNYTTGLEKIAPLKTEYENLLAKYNDLNSSYTADTEKLAAQKTAYEKALAASKVPSPWGTSMPHLARGGIVPGYAEEGYVDVENPAPMVFPDYNAKPAQQIEPAGGGYVPSTDLTGINPELAAMLKQYNAGSDYSKEIAANAAARRQQEAKFNQSITTLKQSAADVPSESEKWFKLAAAFSNPGKTGSFFEGLGNAASALAEHKAEARKGLAAQRKLNADLDLKQQEYALENLRDEATQLRALQGETSKERREMIKAAIKDYVESGKPQSEAGKIALDEGFKRGTPEYEARVTAITKQKLDNQIGILNATLGNLALNQQKVELQKITLEPDERKSIREDEDAMHAAKGVVKNLTEALKLNDLAFANTPADRATYNKLKTTKPNDPRVKATEDLENLVGLNAIGSLKTTFGGNPTEGERSALKELGGLGAANKEVRGKIFQRAAAALNEAIDYRDARIKKIESGGYRKSPVSAGKKE